MAHDLGDLARDALGTCMHHTIDDNGLGIYDCSCILLSVAHDLARDALGTYTTKLYLYRSTSDVHVSVFFNVKLDQSSPRTYNCTSNCSCKSY